MVNRRRWVPRSRFPLSHKDHQRPSHQRAPAHQLNSPPARSAAAKPRSVPIATRPFRWAQRNVSLVEQLSSPFIVTNRSEQSQIRNPGKHLRKRTTRRDITSHGYHIRYQSRNLNNNLFPRHKTVSLEIFPLWIYPRMVFSANPNAETVGEWIILPVHNRRYASPAFRILIFMYS